MLHVDVNTNRLPEGIYRIKPQYFKAATGIKPTIQVEQAEVGYMVDGTPSKRRIIEKYYAFAHA